MNASKSTLLAATAVASLIASTGAMALPANYPAAEIRGNGASAVAVVAAKELNCLGNAVNKDLGLGTGATQNVAEHLYQPITPSLSNPVFDCGTGAATERSVQPNITGYYISTGSSAGRNNWAGFVGTNGITTNPFGTWSNIQYAFSEGPATAANLTTYSGAPVAAGAGAAIQVPFYVVPITIAYAPVYGKRDTGSGVVNLALNVKSTFIAKDGAGLPVGGLRMKKTTYCGIMNGTITNWNDAALTADNGGQSLRDPADDLARWNSTGVPIILVGRSDGSGSTSLFTRHLDALGGGTGGANVAGCVGGQLDTNAGGTDNLPAGARGGNAVFDKVTGALTSGTITAGEFGIVNGSDGVAATVGQTIATPGPGATTLGGYLGYVGADWVLPSTTGSGTPALFAAALQSGTTTAFKMPNAVNAIAAFGTSYLPPQSATTGKYSLTPAPGSTGNRNDPLAWVLPATATDRLANPVAGYPIIGTSNLLMYTCYSTPEKRLAMNAFANLHFGKITKDFADAKIPAALVTSTGKGADLYPLGILARNGLAPLPASWKNAILETFFSKTISGANPSTLNLWIQDKLPTTAALIDGNPANGEVVGNSTCSGTTGA